MLIEPIQGEGGYPPDPSEMLAAARDACDEHGAMLIFDEIQCGMGRTGDWWGWEESGVEPDAMTVAKGLGGGLPDRRVPHRRPSTPTCSSRATTGPRLPAGR